MSKKAYTAVVYSVLFVLLCTSVAFFIFPKEPQFAYEFNIGEPWRYDDLIADEDFAVFKSEAVVQAEEDSIRKSQVPYYDVDTAAFARYATRLHAVVQQFDTMQSVDTKLLTQLRTYRTFADSIFAAYRSRGTLKAADSVKSNDYILYVLNHGHYEISYGSEFAYSDDLQHDLQSRYDSLHLNLADAQTDNKIRDFLASTTPPFNVVYNSSLTENVLKNSLNDLSKVSGVVQSGEIIARKGNIINELTFRKLSSLKRHFDIANKDTDNFMIALGSFLLYLIMFAALFLFYYKYHKDILFSLKNICFFVLQVLLILVLSFVVFHFFNLNISILPFTLSILLMMAFFPSYITFVTFVISIILAANYAANSYEFIVIQITTGLVSMFIMKYVQKRRQIFVTTLLVLLSYYIISVSFFLMHYGTVDGRYLDELTNYTVSALLLLLYHPFIFVIEKIFGFLSGFTLMELCDTNNKALRELSERAPGTFQHSMQVANLAESVVRELGGNYLLVRAGALYHDLGKMSHPEYYVENQTGYNVLVDKDFEESAKMIISHVDEGVKIASKYKLPEQIVNFIRMHHGTGLTRYFYNSWINTHQGETPDAAKFTYPGPKPQTFETVILMMADAIEAASRTLPNYNPETINKLIDNIVDSQMNMGQYSDVDITMKQIKEAKAIFAKKIKNIYHSRIPYPTIQTTT